MVLVPKFSYKLWYAGSQSDLYQKGDLVDFIQRDMNIGSLGFKMGQTPFDDEVPIIIESKSDFNPIKNVFNG